MKLKMEKQKKITLKISIQFISFSKTDKEKWETQITNIKNERKDVIGVSADIKKIRK